MKNKLVLGTVQLGMPYGVNNKTGQPKRDDAFEILDRAFQAGITMFDTGAAYGTSEEVIGRWIEVRDLSRKVKIVSKLPPSPGGDINVVVSAVKDSLSKLNIQKLDGYLLHSPGDMESKSLVEGMKAVRDGGHVDHIGVSVYEPEQAARVAELGFDYIQVPYSVFDRRLDKSGFFKLAKEKGMIVFARSTFLQGLLLMEPHLVPDSLSHARPYIERFRAVSSKYGLSPLQAALSYACNHPGIDHIVFGVETKAQLEEILSVETEGSESCMKELEEVFPDVDASIIDPRIWPKKS